MLAKVEDTRGQNCIRPPTEYPFGQMIKATHAATGDDRNSHRVGDGAQAAGFAARAQGQRESAASGAAGASDPMQVRVGIAGMAPRAAPTPEEQAKLDKEAKKEKEKARLRTFSDEDEAILAYQLRADTGVTLHEPVRAYVKAWDEAAGSLVDTWTETTIGRIIFNQVLPDRLRYSNKVMTRAELKGLVDECYRLLGPEETAHLVDGIKSVGFEFATRGGMTIAVDDIAIPKDKAQRLAQALARME